MRCQYLAQAAQCKAQSIPAPLAGYTDVLFLGASVSGGGISAEMKEYIRSLDKAQIGMVAVFSTSALVQRAFPQIKKEFEKEGITVCPQDFYCRGQFTVLHRGRPNGQDLESAKRFESDILAQAVYNGRTTHEICIHPGMITIYSPREYASKYKPEDYIKGNVESEIRNATIAKILYLNKSIEQFGSGFKRIDSLCRDAGIRYTYENRENGFKFVIYRPKPQSDNSDVTFDVTLNGTEMAVLAILKQKPNSSREEIAGRISKMVRTVQRALDSLREKGYIRRVGSKQASTWEVLK